jgi:beta-galactosidase
MFNRRLFILIIALGFAFGVLILKWNEMPGIALKAASGPISTSRWSMDISGQWKMYDSLRQAWITETEKAMGEDSTFQITGGSLGHLPSSEGFKVAAKTFKVPAEWNARTLVLQLSGVQGKLSIYINGMESTNRIGMIDSEGGIERLEIPVKALRYGQDNHVFLAISAPLSQERTLFGTQYPIKGQITGSILLQAVMETSLENPQVKVSWEKGNANIQLNLILKHHGFLENGPWTVQGILSDGSAEVTQSSVQVNSNENVEQPISMNLRVENGRLWSPTDPYLYQLYLTITNPKGDKDDLAFPIALSSLQFEEGVFQSKGERLPIKGLAIQPDTEYRVRETGEITTWLKETKNKGYNLLYFVKGFPDELWLQEADKLGIGIWSELPGNSMVPAKRLTQPEKWENLIRIGSLHPSVWAYTVGQGLEVNPKGAFNAYEKEIHKLTNPAPVFNLGLTDSFVFEPEYSLTYTGNQVQGAWGEIELAEGAYGDLEGRWPQERWASSLWAIIICIIFFLNLFAENWRYKELKTKKPKRALRKAWFRNGLALLSREMTLAGVITSVFFHIETPWALWIPNQWPLWEAFKLQSPWMIWMILGLLFTLIRLLQVGVVAPYMPELPSPMGLALWLERRYQWIWIVALLWAAHPWGIPRYFPIIAYMGFTILFLPFKIRDVRRVGGRYSFFFVVPGLIIAVLSIVNLFRWEDWLYFWRLIQGYGFSV